MTIYQSVEDMPEKVAHQLAARVSEMKFFSKSGKHNHLQPITFAE